MAGDVVLFVVKTPDLQKITDLIGGK